MAFILLFIGILLLVAGINNTYGQLTGLVYNDFTGQGNFIYWVAAILIIGAIGYIPKAKPVSDALLVLIILVLVLSRGNPKFNTGGGFFQQFTNALKGTQAPAQAPAAGKLATITF